MKGIVFSTCLLALASAALAAPQMPQTPAAVDDLVYAQTFKLNEAFRYDWAKEPFMVSEGTLLVLKVKPEYATPRQALEPMLYVGDHAAMRLNRGENTGYMVVVVPGAIDLSKTPIWFGTPNVAGRVDNATVQAERALAEKAGIQPFSAEKIAAATGRGGACMNAADFSVVLHERAAGLITQYCPDEKGLAASLGAPIGPIKAAEDGK